jgi:3-oxoacyl-[acyl-carrier protein] reductase
MRVLVTGGSKGIGKAIKDEFEAKGHTVYAPTREELNLSDKDFVLKETSFNVVINCAGINPLANFLEASEEEVMQVNYFAPLSIIKQCLPDMIRSQYGRIVNIGSIWVEMTKQNRSAYSASKNALNSIAKSITAEYTRYGILCNTLSPGFTATELTYQNNSTEELERIQKTIPANRLAIPLEIAKAAYYLAIDNTYISGQNIIIDGGYSCTAL